jgi:23S rRNA (adenine2503-C2)-methyltransferase
MAVKIFMEAKGIGIGSRKITISTAGILSQLRLGPPKVSWAFSLNGVGKVRDLLMPINKKYSYKEVIECLDGLARRFSNPVTYEYILLAGVNDSMAQLEQVGQLLNPRLSKVNLISFNQFSGCRFVAADGATFLKWQKYLNQRGIICTIRNSKGSDIMAACGQLSSSFSS